MDTGPVLGLSPLRPTLLDDLSSAESRKGQNGPGARLVTPHHELPGQCATPGFDLDDDLDDDEEDEEDDEDGQKDDEDDDEDDEDDEEEGDEDEPETWQVVRQVVPLTSLRETA
jgi:hypothetical protein